jgi:hypothetical protein
VDEKKRQSFARVAPRRRPHKNGQASMERTAANLQPADEARFGLLLKPFRPLVAVEEDLGLVAEGTGGAPFIVRVGHQPCSITGAPDLEQILHAQRPRSRELKGPRSRGIVELERRSEAGPGDLLVQTDAVELPRLVGEAEEDGASLDARTARYAGRHPAISGVPS